MYNLLEMLFFLADNNNLNVQIVNKFYKLKIILSPMAIFNLKPF